MKFEEYISYLKEGTTDLSTGIHINDHVKVATDSLAGYAKFDIEDATNYEVTKDMILTVECKVGNMGKKILTFASIAGVEGADTKDMSKALTKVKGKLQESTASYLHAIEEAFTANGFTFVSKSELKTLVVANTTEPKEDEQEETKETKPTAKETDWDELEEI